MIPKLVEEGWSEELIEAIRLDGSDLRIICPFIKAGPIERLLRHRPGKGEIKVITRFNLADCADGVSDVAALRKLLDAGAAVRGVRNLHAKLYLFGKSRAIITSCNLTDAALSRNHELGLVVDDEPIVTGCLKYFDRLWQRAGTDLQPERVAEWDERVRACQVGGGRPNAVRDLGDFGTDVDLDFEPPPQSLDPLAQAPQAFVKFMGTAGFLVPPSTPVLEEIERSGCHREACYPSRRRPRSVRDGATIFMGRLTDEPDIRVFGRATAKAHHPEKDNATEADIERRSWRKDWSRYIRVRHAEFLEGTIGDGISLNELMDELEFKSFASTKRNKESGKGNTNPRLSYRQHPAVELSDEGRRWLSRQLSEAFEKHGKVPQDTLEALDRPDP